jgi:hypothetical protein
MITMVLDLATHTGFAVGDAAGVQGHGSFKMPATGGDIGTFLSHYRTWLNAAITRWAPGEIIFEMPILGAGMSLPVLRKLYGLCCLTELICKDHGIKCGEANLLDIRRHFIGTHRAPKDLRCKTGCQVKSCARCRDARRGWLKEATISMCRKRGFRPADDNDGDALALFSYVQSTRNPTWELLGTEIARAA